MKKRAAKAALVFIEVTALLAAIIAAGGALLYMRLRQGPVSLAGFSGVAEAAIERRLPAGYDAEAGGLLLLNYGSAVRLEILDLTIADEEGDDIAAADRVDFVFNLADLFAGSIGPREIEAEGAAFRIVRNAQRAVKIPAARGRRGSLFTQSSNLVEAGFLRSAFSRAEMRDVDVVFFDEASGRAWRSKDAVLAFTRTPTGVSGELRGSIDGDGESHARLEAAGFYSETEDLISISAQGQDFPIGDLLTMFYGERARVVDAPVTGQAEIEFTPEGKVRSSVFNAMIGSGALNIGSLSAPIDFIKWRTRFDPAENAFSIDSFEYAVGENKGAVSGAVRLEFEGDARSPQRVLFDIAATDVTAAAQGFFAAPIAVSTAQFAGSYDVEETRLLIDQLALDALGVSLAGSLGYELGGIDETGARMSPGVSAELAMAGALDPQRLLSGWPLTAGLGARDWVETRLETAVIDNVRARIDVEPGAVTRVGHLPDEAMEVTFDVSGAKAFYVLGMTPLTEAAGSGTLRGNSFLLKARTARVGDVDISEGEVEFPVFTPKWQETFYRFTATGRSEDILAVLDQAPLNLLSKINLSPSQFAGEAVAEIEIMRPNMRDAPRDSYEYYGEATFEGMTVSGLAGDATLTDASGAVSLKPRSMTVSAEADLADAPIDLVWKKNFYAAEGPSQINVSGVFDASVADLFGLSLRQYVRGPVAAKATAEGELGDFRNLDISADFTDAGMSIDLIGWSKPAGASAQGAIALRFDGDEISVDRLELGGDSVAMEGNARWKSGALEAAAFPVFKFGGAADIAVAARRAPGGELDLTLTGDYFNAGPSVLHFTKGDGMNDRADAQDDADADLWGRGLKLTGRIDRLDLRKGVSYADASLDLWRDGEALQALDFSALNQDGAPLKVTLARTGDEDGPARRIDVRSSNLGYFLQGVTGLVSLQGGEGSMALYFGDQNRSGVYGELEARAMHVENAPLLARIFSAGSLDGLANLVQGEGIDLNYAYGQFDFADDRLNLRDFRATGSSVGITAEGDVSFARDGVIDMMGAVAPAYQLNSAIGAAPIIGDILVGREGEGIVALSYSVSGAVNSPDVFVNPLSALTPGVFRQIFEGGRASEPPAPAPEGPAPDEPAPNPNE
ncbi:MAG: AsmA-like C-terminal domain-containing protein [Pseudomonadota bacterium]